MQTTVPNSQAAPTSPTTSRFDNSILGALIVAGALIVVTAAVVFMWRSLRSPTAAVTDRYFPAVHGAALTYRIVNPGGSVTYRSRNLARTSANTILSQLSNDAFVALMQAADIDLNKLNAAAALSQLANYETVLIHDIESDPQGNPKTKTDTRALIVENALTQFSVNAIGINPPIPILPPSDTPQTLEGKLNEQTTYRLTQELDERGAQTTALGEFPDCIHIRSVLTINTTVTQNRTWYCAGIGEVSDEFTDAVGTHRTAIIAASIGTFQRGDTPILPSPDVNAALQRHFPDPLQGTLIRLLDYKEPTDSLGITTNVLPVSSLLLYGTQSGALVALDRADETEAWRFQTGASVFSTPVVVNGIAYFGSADKKVYAVRVSDGAYIWAYPTKDVVSASPAVNGDTAFFASEDRNVYALDADTGRLRWTFTSGSPFIAPPVLANEKLFVSNNDGGLFALDPSTGQLLWDFAAGSAVTTPVVVDNGVVYFGAYDETVYALDASSGSQLWSRLVADYVVQPVIVANNRVYVRLPEEVFALDTTTGSPVWHYKSPYPLYGAPLLMGNQLWLLETNNLFALDAATGAVTQQVPTTETSTYSGISTNGREIYIGYFDGQLLGFVGVAR